MPRNWTDDGAAASLRRPPDTLRRRVLALHLQVVRRRRGYHLREPNAD